MTGLGTAEDNGVIWTSYLVSTTSQGKITHLSPWHTAIRCISKNPGLVTDRGEAHVGYVRAAIVSRQVEAGLLLLRRCKGRDIKRSKEPAGLVCPTTCPKANEIPFDVLSHDDHNHRRKGRLLRSEWHAT
jgi:hypothetical protein